MLRCDAECNSTFSLAAGRGKPYEEGRMNEWLHTLILSVIEGITEFLPISSTGHLLIAENFLGDKRSEFFNVGIQAGAVLAVVLIYWRRLLELTLRWREKKNFDFILKLGIAFVVTAAVGLPARKLGFSLDESSLPAIAGATLVGAWFIFFAEWRVKKNPVRESVSWGEAAIIGVAQAMAGIFPGLSRSGATIITGLLLGCSRPTATEFSFLLGIPTMFAATALTALKEFQDHRESSQNEMAHFALGFIVSLIVAFAVVKWLLTYVRSHTFIPFAWYRLVMGTALFIWWYNFGG